jgi:outer membrane protein insertion porin family
VEPVASPKVTAVVLHLPSGMASAEFIPLVVVRRDQPLDAREVRRSIALLFATGRFSDVVATAYPEADGVAVVFECAPVAHVRLVVVTGNQVLTRSEVLAAAHLAEGSEVYPEKLAEAKEGVLQAYARKGWNQAQVVITETHEGAALDLGLTITEGEPTRVTEVRFSGSPELSEARLREVFGLPTGIILDRGLLEKGTERLRALYRETHHFRARVGTPTVQQQLTGAVVTVPIDAGPVLALAVRGNRRFPDRVLLAALAYEPTEALDRSTENRLARRLENFYRYRGFAEVQVAPSEFADPHGGPTQVVFAVEEGPVVRVTEITFEGAASLSSARLRRILSEVIASKVPPLPSDPRLLTDPTGSEGQSTELLPAPELLPLEIFVEEAYRDGADALQASYRDAGFLGARVQLTALEEDVERHQMRVRFHVEEGVQTRVEAVSFEGLPPGFVPPPSAELAPGAPLSQRAMDQVRAELVLRLARASYLFARVQVRPELSSQARLARVVVHAEPGPAVRVGQVVIRGLQRTDEQLVRENLTVRPGRPLDPEQLYESQRNLLALGIFRQVSVTLFAPDAEESVKDVLVEARERPLLSGSGGFGYSTVDGPRVVGDLVYPNLFGEAINFTARGKVNYVGLSFLPLQDFTPSSELQGLQGIDFNFNVTISQARIPWLLPQQISARITFVAERVHRPSYFFGRVAGIGGMEWQINSWLSFIGQYTVEGDLVRNYNALSALLATSSVDLTRLRFPTGNYALQTLSPAFTLDFRDNAINPTRGILINAVGELTKDLSAEVTDAFGNNAIPTSIFTWKVSGGISGYIPMTERVVLALSLRGGRIFNLIKGGQIIPPKRFYLGGVTTLRGFPEDGLIAEDLHNLYRDQRNSCAALVWSGGCTPAGIVLSEGRQIPSQGGELFTLIKAELRFPAILGFDLGLFLEAGNLWADPSQYKPLVLRPVAGVGLRYGTPIGPLALDVGFNLNPYTPLNEQLFAIQFSVGVF